MSAPSSPRTLVLGAQGLLGRAAVAEGRRRGAEVVGLGRAEADLLRPREVRRALAAFRPDVVVNCAALTRVDDCESRRDEAFEVNAAAVGRLAAAADEAGARLVHLSTDYVFDGRASSPYREEDAAAPLSIYGASKLAGEEEALRGGGALVVRTSWLFGAAGRSFVSAILECLRAGGPLRVVSDQEGCPTYAPYLAGALWDLATLRRTGILHYRNRDPVSWHGFACAIVRAVRSDVEVEPIATTEMPRPAARPRYSVLDTSRVEAALGRPVEPWMEGLAEHLATLGHRPPEATQGGEAPRKGER